MLRFLLHLNILSSPYWLRTLNLLLVLIKLKIIPHWFILPLLCQKPYKKHFKTVYFFLLLDWKGRLISANLQRCDIERSLLKLVNKVSQDVFLLLKRLDIQILNNVIKSFNTFYPLELSPLLSIYELGSGILKPHLIPL